MFSTTVKFKMCCFSVINRYRLRYLQMGIIFKYSASPFLTDKELELVGSGLRGSNRVMVQAIFSIILAVWLLRSDTYSNKLTND